MESDSFIWNLQLQDIDSLENVQRYFTERLLNFSGLSYQSRLEKLDLESLEFRRIKFDLIICYKIIHQLIDLNFENYFTLNSSSTRGHKYKLWKKRSNLDISKFFFSNRIVLLWNSLPEYVVNSPTLQTFKKAVNKLHLPIRGHALVE